VIELWDLFKQLGIERKNLRRPLFSSGASRRWRCKVDREHTAAIFRRWTRAIHLSWAKWN